MRKYRKITITIVTMAVLAGVFLVLHNSGRNATANSGVTVSGPGAPANFTAVSEPGPIKSIGRSRVFVQGSSVFRLGPSGKLGGTGTVTLPLLAPHPTSEPVVVASREGREPWRFLKAVVLPDRTHVRFSTDRFSLFVALFAGLADQFRQEIRPFFDSLTAGFTAEAKRPSCAGQSTVTQQGYVVRSTNSDTVYWCIGTQEGKPVLQVVNNRRYALQANHPGMRALNRGWFDYVSKIDPESTTIEARNTLRLDATTPAGQQRVVRIEYNGLAQSIYQISVAVDLLVDFATRFGTRPSENVLAQVLEKRECARALYGDVVHALRVCFSGQVLSSLLGPVSVLLAPLTASGSLLTFLRSELNALGDQFGNRANYTILVARQATAPACLDADMFRTAYGSRLYPGQSVTGVEQITCSGRWAVGLVQVQEGGAGSPGETPTINAYTGLVQYRDGAWVALDPAGPCGSGQVPGKLRMLACESN